MSLEQLQRDVEAATGLLATVRVVDDGSYGAFVEMGRKRFAGRSKTIRGVVQIVASMVEDERAGNAAHSEKQDGVA